MPVRKQTRDLDWEDLRYFVALTRHGSLSATARGLRVTHATVARRVMNLEGLLGRPLFERRADGYSLTAEGKALLDEANAMEEAALAVLRRMDTSNELNGLVRLTATRALADSFLIDRLGELHERYPGIDLELIGDSRVVSLARRQADIALRLGSSKDSDLMARRVASIAFGLYASPAYRDKLAPGQTPAIIGFDRDSDFIFEAAWLTRQFPTKRFVFRTNSQISQAAAARAGYGVALLPRYLTVNDPGLVPVQFAEPLPNRDVWLLIRRDLTKVPAIRAVADYLVELFRRERHLLAND
ncbi:MAG: LysR family transcriptional regulator [Pseudonocardiales bacterium]|nr:LysR family transcriptional regulator [Hyphomicrobiales bacterium]MBV8825530.1 LysR family transcriptional regulator [Hyphomicrobiales bacterium]MBV9429456.1 LysR family transcriptional regulator [Bradyrhizobiaceae bacterium]MBV9728124.1 LysR family transcriptional regulator [Pseudonocardiales bacterium]